MDLKTIGGFIAALRKANGMTQKELAEKLNVSDKSVSRWECGDSAPDLSLIPVIAEIFNVSCDELLRGERRSPAARAETADETAPSQKGEKQLRRILAVSLSKFRVRSFIAAGIAAGGLIAAMVCNFGFLRAWLGAFISAVFYLAAFIAQAVFLNNAFLSVSDEDLAPQDTGSFRRSVILLSEFVFAFIALLFAFTLPLVLYPHDTYIGMSKASWFEYGAVFGVLTLLAALLICHFLNAALHKRGVYTLGEKAERIYLHNTKLKRHIALILAAVIVATGIAHALSTELWGPGSIVEGTTFHDYESFVAFMEKDVPVDSVVGNGSSASAPVAAAPVGETVYYDEYGNEISEEEAMRRTIKDKNGNVVCEYIDRNHSVSSIRYTPGDGTALPITVVTYDEFYAAQAVVKVRNAVFLVVYCIEVSLAVLVYFLKRER
ncbi:MAG: helix-turn-helix transcriptional regulator [Clostridia bacterium]|nr:helix-turn-helix transcriptional regulator [Clostridia bacterium]